MNKPRKLVQDYYFGNPISIAEKILFVKRGVRFAEYKDHLTDVEEFGNIWQGLTGKLRNETVSIIATGIGPSLVGDSVYAIDKPGAVCLYSGTCGGLSQNLEIGDYFLATQAICADGYCLTFGEGAFTTVNADGILINSIQSSFTQLHIPYSAGLTFTTGSIVRGNDLDFWKFVNPDCQTIEMGCAPFYLAALRSQKRALHIFG